MACGCRGRGRARSSEETASRLAARGTTWEHVGDDGSVTRFWSQTDAIDMQINHGGAVREVVPQGL